MMIDVLIGRGQQTKRDLAVTANKARVFVGNGACVRRRPAKARRPSISAGRPGRIHGSEASVMAIEDNDDKENARVQEKQ